MGQVYKQSVSLPFAASVQSHISSFVFKCGPKRFLLSIQTGTGSAVVDQDVTHELHLPLLQIRREEGAISAFRRLHSFNLFNHVKSIENQFSFTRRTWPRGSSTVHTSDTNSTDTIQYDKHMAKNIVKLINTTYKIKAGSMEERSEGWSASKERMHAMAP